MKTEKKLFNTSKYSRAVIIPPEMLKALKITDETRLELSVVSDMLIIKIAD
jgi:antitoxin component of MazEF toxin-antitoxin module